MRSNFYIKLLIGIAALLSSCAVNAAELSATPILRVNADMHTAMIRRVAVDAAGRYLVTASEDKTAKVWDLASGRLLNTLRPPQDAGNEGRLYALAMSPDGATVAVAGWTGWDWDRSCSIYLFDRATGHLLRRLSGLPSVIFDLTWSADGRFLAAGLHAGKGIFVYRTDTWTLVGSDSDYGSGSYGLDFSRDGKLITSSFDGYLRLYTLSMNGLRLLAKRTVPGGQHPFDVRFSPDGLKIAVGFDDTARVNVLDAVTLDLLYAPDTTGIDAGNFYNVAWSADGAGLWAGGLYWHNGSFPIRYWSDSGRGPARESAVALSTISSIRSLPNGGVVFGVSGPAWGVLDVSGERSRFVEGPIADFRSNYSGFRLSRDGLTVGFGYEVFGKSPAQFDLNEGLSLGETSAIPLVAPLTEFSGLSITDWKGNAAPKLNGAALALRPTEQSQSLAIASGGNFFVLGTNNCVRLFERNGTQRWEVPSNGSTWGVNLSGDGRYVVAAFSDGTIRWYATGDGREQLAFFPHAEKKRWVAWTPSGYYSASPGGDELIGWHLNQGKDQAADFFPASRFRAQFYRPDVIAQALNAGSEAAALQMANEQAGRKNIAPVAVQAILPPVVNIVSPADGDSVSNAMVTLRYITRSPDDAPVTSVRARVNGQAVSNERALKRVQGETQEIIITIPPQDSEIQLFAENKNGMSTPVVVRVKWAGKAAPAEAGFTIKPKLYVLAVGVSKYKNADYNLELAAKDATDFAAVFQKQKGKLYGEVVVKLLTDNNATRDDIVDGLDWLKQQVTAHDVGVMFLAGHGMNDNTGKYFFLPHNADPDKLMRTGVAQTDIKDTLNTLAGKAMFFVDSCHAGNALGSSKTRAIGGTTDAFVSELASAENGVIVFSSSTGKQLSQENPAWGNGAFTKAVVEGLSGKADFAKNGKITHKGLDYYVTERVKELTKGQQSPVSISPSGVTDFPIAVTEH
jgi:WD40 repeat protein